MDKEILVPLVDIKPISSHLAWYGVVPKLYWVREDLKHFPATVHLRREVNEEDSSSN